MLIFPCNSLMLSITLHTEERFLANSSRVSNMRHCTIRLNEWIGLDLVVFKLYYFKEYLFEMKFSREIWTYLRVEARSALVEMNQGMLLCPSSPNGTFSHLVRTFTLKTSVVDLYSPF